ISPVESLVFMRLSPSPPPGWVSTVTLMSGLAAVKASPIASIVSAPSPDDAMSTLISRPSPPPSPPPPMLPTLHDASGRASAVMPTVPSRNLLVREFFISYLHVKADPYRPHQ